MSAAVISTGRNVDADNESEARKLLLTEVPCVKITLQPEFLGARPKEIRERDDISDGTPPNDIHVRDSYGAFDSDPGQ